MKKRVKYLLSIIGTSSCVLGGGITLLTASCGKNDKNGNTSASLICDSFPEILSVVSPTMHSRPLLDKAIVNFADDFDDKDTNNGSMLDEIKNNLSLSTYLYGFCTSIASTMWYEILTATSFQLPVPKFSKITLSVEFNNDKQIKCEAQYDETISTNTVHITIKSNEFQPLVLAGREVASVPGTTEGTSYYMDGLLWGSTSTSDTCFSTIYSEEGFPDDIVNHNSMCFGSVIPDITGYFLDEVFPNVANWPTEPQLI